MYNYYAPFQRPMGYYNPSIPMGQDTQNYQPMAQYQQPTPTATPQNAGGLIWVLNESEATSYPVAPNNSVTLWDKERDTVYIKSVNMQGVPSMRILDYTERVPENGTKIAQNGSNADGGKFVREDDFKALQTKFDGLREEINELKAKRTKSARANKAEDVDDE